MSKVATETMHHCHFCLDNLFNMCICVVFVISRIVITKLGNSFGVKWIRFLYLSLHPCWFVKDVLQTKHYIDHKLITATKSNIKVIMCRMQVDDNVFTGLLQNYVIWVNLIMGNQFKTVCHLIIIQLHNLLYYWSVATGMWICQHSPKMSVC